MPAIKPNSILVRELGGMTGWIENSDSFLDGAASGVEILFEDGRKAEVPSAALIRQDDGTYLLPLNLKEQQIDSEASVTVVPIVAEEAKFSKRLIRTGRVRLTKSVRSRDEIVDQALYRETVEVRRVPIGRVLETSPEVRHDGETMIIPVVEEILVVEKRLVLREELHVTRHRIAEHQPQTITLRSEEVTVERLGPEGDETQTGVREAK